VPDHFGGHVFEALALLAANLALGLAAVRTKFFLRLDPLSERLQHFGRGLAAHARLGLFLRQVEQDLLCGRRLGRRGKERHQNLLFGKVPINAPLGSRTEELLLQLRHPPERLLQFSVQRTDERVRLRQRGWQ
jgi:hypothetical protein